MGNGNVSTVGNWPSHLLQMKLCKCDSSSCHTSNVCVYVFLYVSGVCVCVVDPQIQ